VKNRQSVRQTNALFAIILTTYYIIYELSSQRHKLGIKKLHLILPSFLKVVLEAEQLFTFTKTNYLLWNTVH